mmetsp:Transcript_33515/g.58708  ORF Transcript_33515/g.58708 Transcript_33515/m.58708 type:complete len:663 (-) Transcript_33515:23-2011(-)
MGVCGAKHINRVQYSEFVGEERPGETRTLRCVGHSTEFIREPEPGISTLYLAQSKAFRTYGQKDFLGTVVDGQYRFKTYNQIQGEAVALGSVLVDLVNEVVEDGKVFRFVGIYSANREEWITTSIACTHFSFVSLPLYDSLGVDSIEYILEQTGTQVVLVSAANYPKLITQKKQGKSGRLSTIVQFEPVKPEQVEETRKLGLRLLDWSAILRQGRENQKPLRPPTKKDVLTVSYTSGTTGFPKGAVITHEAMLSSMAASKTRLPISSTDVHLSFLPLAHIYERLVSESFIYNGGTIGFWRGNITAIRDDFALLRPTVLAAVPRLLNRFADVIKERFNEATGLKRSLINKAISAKLEELRENTTFTHSLYDKLIFNKVKQVLGGRVRFGVTGSAPISPEVLDFLKICFCCPLIEGYGQTETNAASCMTMFSDPESGHVGGPMPCIEVKLQDIPEMNYTTTSRDASMNITPCGEVCFRGPAVFSGYFRLPDKTAEAIDEEGWLHSGDVGMLLPNGAIRLIDRKKNIFKLSQGEYIAPEKIENLLVQIPEIAQVFIYGESIEAHLVAIVVPDEPKLKAQAQKLGVQGTHAEVCSNPKVVEKVLSDISTFARSGGLFGFEIPKAIYLSPTPFSIENDLLTPTMKLKRHDAKLRFKDELKRLYSISR